MVAALLTLQVKFGVLQLGRKSLRFLLQLLDVSLGLFVIGLQVADLHTHTHTHIVYCQASARLRHEKPEKNLDLVKVNAFSGPTCSVSAEKQGQDQLVSCGNEKCSFDLNPVSTKA